MSKTFSIFPFTTNDKVRVDVRLKQFTDGWKLVEIYKGKTVTIPGDWNSDFRIINYFQVIKKSTDPNAGEEENEIGLRIEGGWFPYDTEVIINLMITGLDVLSGKEKVYAEIFKAGSASMKLYHNDKQVTDFTKKETKKTWWGTSNVTIPADKVWLELKNR